MAAMAREILAWQLEAPSSAPPSGNGTIHPQAAGSLEPSQRVSEAVAALRMLLAQCEAWLDNLPELAEDTPIASGKPWRRSRATWLGSMSSTCPEDSVAT